LLNNDGEMVLIDFGLGGGDGTAEDKAVDLYVLERALAATHPNMEPLTANIISAYEKVFFFSFLNAFVSIYNIFRITPKPKMS